MWHRKTLGVLTSLSILLAACGQGGGQQGQQSPGPEASDPGLAAEQVLRVDIGNEPPTLDPNQAEDSVAISVLRSITRPLVYFDENLEAVPGLAESWEINEAGDQITFTIREDARYSDGSDIVAEDFVYGWRRLLDPRTAAPYSYVMADVAGGEEILGLDPEALPADDEIDALLEDLGVEAVDEKTFQVTLVRPATYFLYIAALWVTAPIKAEWIEGDDPTEAGNFLSSGPFVLDTWEHNSQIILKPNPEWFGEQAKLTEIRMAMSGEPTVGLAAYEAGELDAWTGVPAEELPRILEDPERQDEIQRAANFSLAYFGFDMEEGPTAESMNLRYALTQSIDRQQMIDVTWGGLGVAAGSSVPPGMIGHQPDIGIPYDPDAAQESLAAALEELGIADAGDITLTLGYNTEAGHEPRVEFLQEQWRQTLGINIELEGLEWGAYLDQLDEDPFDIFRLGWGADFPHGFNFLSDLFRTGGGNNNMRYSNPEFDETLTAAAAETDPAAQEALLNEAQEIVVEDAPVFFVRWAETVSLIQPYVQGLVPTGQDSQLVGELFLENVFITVAESQ